MRTDASALQLELQRISSPQDDRVRRLLAASDGYLESLYPPESIHADPIEVLTGDSAGFFAGFVGGTAVACGALKFVDGDIRYGEIKRLFVDDVFRGRRFGTAVMKQLERFARENEIAVIRLETGTRQPEAQRLYASLGYRIREPFGSYWNDPLSIFMEKSLL